MEAEDEAEREHLSEPTQQRRADDRGESKLVTLPNFLVIGAGRAGTTSLYNYLRQHPEIYMSPIKETNFWAYLGEGLRDEDLDRHGGTIVFPVRSLQKYEGLFEGIASEKAIGEVSPRYMASKDTAACIADHLPNVKPIAILRDPVERAYSSYLFHRRDGRETRTFETAIDEEESGTVSDALRHGQRRYVGLGYYYRRLKPYFELFPEHTAVFLFDDLRSDPLGLMRDLFRFLQVRPSFVPDMSVRYNVSGIPTGRLARTVFRKRPALIRAKRAMPPAIQNWLDRVIEPARAARLDAPPLNPDTRQRLAMRYEEDVGKLAKLIDRDLSGWLA